jgi:hypothetical protein
MNKKSGIDQDALIKMFSEATAKQGETLRKAVSEAALKALQGRELTLDNIRKVLKTITQAASAGAAQNPASAVDIEALLGKAIAGMDSALLQTVQANQRALQQFVDQGVDLREKQLKSALDNLEKMGDVFFTTVSKAVKDAGDTIQGPWEQVLKTMKLKGTDTGAQAALTVEELMAHAQTALRDSRATSVRAAQAMMDSYAALVSGVLIGMSGALQPGTESTTSGGRSRKK